MRVGALIVSLVVGWTASPAVAQVAAPQDLKYPTLPDVPIPKPTRVVLPNGLVLMVLEDHELPLVSASAMLRTGSLLEPAEKTGLADVTGSLLRDGGTEALAPDQLDEFLEARAASIESGIGQDSGSISMNALKADFPEVFRVFADVLRKPRFDPKRLEVELTQQRASIARQNDNPSGIRAREFAQVIYGEQSPYGRIPTYASIAAVSRDDLVAWHGRFFHPNRVILGIWGDITVKEATALATKVLGDWKKGPDVPPVAQEFPPPSTDPHPGVYEAAKADVTQAFVSVGHQGSLLRTSPDYFAAEVVNEVLSGSFASRLFSNIRSAKGLAYSVGGSIGAGFTRVAPFTMSLSTKTETTVAAIEALIEEARAIQGPKPPTDAEVTLAKNSILNSFIFNSDTTGEILGQQMSYEYYGIPLDWLDRYRAGIEKVATPDVAAAAKKYIDPTKFTIVVVGKADGRDKPLGGVGPVTPLDITIPSPTSKTAAKVVESPVAFLKADAMLDRAVQALGGLEKLRALESIQQTRILEVPRPGAAPMKLKAATTVVVPDKACQELETPMGKMTMVVTPSDAFVRTPQGLMPLPDSQKSRMRREAFLDPLLILRARGTQGFKALHAGMGKAGDAEVHLINVERGEQSVTLGIDSTTGRILSMVHQGEGPDGSPAEIVQVFSDFREVNGFTLPFRATSTSGAQAGPAWAVEAVTINGPVDSTLFEKPAEAKVTPPAEKIPPPKN
jgi:zinc protease